MTCTTVRSTLPELSAAQYLRMDAIHVVLLWRRSASMAPPARTAIYLLWYVWRASYPGFEAPVSVPSSQLGSIPSSASQRAMPKPHTPVCSWACCN